jgi:hypothetical protein
MVLGYLWLNCFSDLDYDYRLFGLSAGVSAIAFLLPALLVTSPIPQIYTMSATAFDRFLTLILLFAVPTIAVGAAHNFRLVSIEQIYDFRDKMASPAILSYLTVMNYSTLLPFAFAGFVERKAYWRSGAVLVLLLFFYPITLTKLALFAPIWLVAILFYFQGSSKPESPLSFRCWSVSSQGSYWLFCSGRMQHRIFQWSIFECSWCLPMASTFITTTFPATISPISARYRF